MSQDALPGAEAYQRILPGAASSSASEPTLGAVPPSPGGGSWSFGPEDTDQVVRGSALELCLRGVDRLDLADAETLTGDGAAARTALRVMRAFP